MYGVPGWAHAVTGLMAMFCCNNNWACMRCLKLLRSRHDGNRHKKHKPRTDLKPSVGLFHSLSPFSWLDGLSLLSGSARALCCLPLCFQQMQANPMLGRTGKSCSYALLKILMQYDMLRGVGSWEISVLSTKGRTI